MAESFAYLRHRLLDAYKGQPGVRLSINDDVLHENAFVAEFEYDSMASYVADLNEREQDGRTAELFRAWKNLLKRELASNTHFEHSIAA